MAGCPACAGPLVDDRERGEVVCAQSGLVVTESTVDVGPEWRTFERERSASELRRLCYDSTMARKTAETTRSGTTRRRMSTSLTTASCGTVRTGS
ncbi:MAG: TFIIB-type zinc ribbon-containing protein [Pyrobaculum sp.]